MCQRRPEPFATLHGKQDRDQRRPQRAEGLTSGIKLAEHPSVTDLDNSVSIPETVQKNGTISPIQREL
jgi:hypothetical protein